MHEATKPGTSIRQPHKLSNTRIEPATRNTVAWWSHDLMTLTTRLSLYNKNIFLAPLWKQDDALYALEFHLSRTLQQSCCNRDSRTPGSLVKFYNSLVNERFLEIQFTFRFVLIPLFCSEIKQSYGKSLCVYIVQGFTRKISSGMVLFDHSYIRTTRRYFFGIFLQLKWSSWLLQRTKRCEGLDLYVFLQSILFDRIDFDSRYLRLIIQHFGL